MKDEKAAFAERLREAMRKAGLTPRPHVLEGLFNQHYSAGGPVSPQAVSAWLGGRAIPKADKLRAIARVLDVEPQELLFGPGVPAVREPRAGWGADFSAQERALVDSLLSLPPAQRKLVADLIRTLSLKAKPPEA